MALGISYIYIYIYIYYTYTYTYTWVVGWGWVGWGGLGWAGVSIYRKGVVGWDGVGCRETMLSQTSSDDSPGYGGLFGLRHRRAAHLASRNTRKYFLSYVARSLLQSL